MGDCADQSTYHDAYGDGDSCHTAFSSLSKGGSFDIDGFTFEITGTNTVSVSEYQKDAKSDVEIPSKVISPSGTEYVVTKIEKGAFKGRLITSVVVPDTVMEVGEEAFMFCKDIVSLSMPIDVICGKNAFFYLKVETLILTKGGTGTIKSEFWNSFQDSVKTLVIEEGITIFGASFRGADGLERVELKDVLAITYGQFYACERLTDVVAPHLVVVGERAFEGCPSLKYVDTPSLKSCGPSAFSKCWNLLEICGANVFVSDGMVFNILDGDSASMIQLIDNEKDVLSLYDVTAPSGKIYNVTQIGEEACCDMNKLNGLYLPDHFKSIGGYAFKGCKNLLTIRVPITLDCCYDTGRLAFQDVKPELLVLTVGNGGKPIQPFWNSWKSCLTGLVVGDGITEFDYSFKNNNKLRMVGLQSVEHIKKSQFESCNKLEVVSIPSAKYIDEYSFKKCKGLLTVEAGVIYSIGYKAFFGCEGLTQFKHNMLKNIGGRAFYNCDDLKEFQFYGTESIGEHAFFNTHVKKPDYLDDSVKIGKKAFGMIKLRSFVKTVVALVIAAVVAIVVAGILYTFGLIGLAAIAAVIALGLMVTACILAITYMIANWGDMESMWK